MVTHVCSKFGCCNLLFNLINLVTSVVVPANEVNLRKNVSRLRVGWFNGFSFITWEGSRESRRCARGTYPESYITKHTSIRRKKTPSCDLFTRQRYLRKARISGS